MLPFLLSKIHFIILCLQVASFLLICKLHEHIIDIYVSIKSRYLLLKVSQVSICADLANASVYSSSFHVIIKDDMVMNFNFGFEFFLMLI